MSTSVKRPLDNGETHSNVPPKTSRLEGGDSDDHSDTGSTIDYVQSEHEDVFYASNVPNPQEAREALDDNDDSVIIVLTKKASMHYPHRTVCYVLSACSGECYITKRRKIACMSTVRPLCIDNSVIML